jgi:hypothetical protein
MGIKGERVKISYNGIIYLKFDTLNIILGIFTYDGFNNWNAS